MRVGVAAGSDDSRCTDEPDEATQNRCARQLYAERRYAAAAEVFAAMWQTWGGAKYLYNASEARVAAGSDGWALALLTEYLGTPGLTDSERTEALRRSEELRERLVAVDVEVVPRAALGEAAVLYLERVLDGGCDGRTPAENHRSDCWRSVGVVERFSYAFHQVAHGEGARVHLERGRWKLWIDPASPAAAYNLGEKAHATSILVRRESQGRVELRPETSELRFVLGPASEISRGVMIHLSDPFHVEPEQILRARPPEVRLALRTGNWRYRVRPRGLFQKAQAGEVVVGDTGTVELRWDPSPAVLAERALQRKIMLGVGGAGAGSLLIGASLLGVGRTEPKCYQGRVPKDCTSEEPALSYKTDEIRRRQELAVAGGGFLGLSVGLGVVTGLEALKPGRMRVLVAVLAGGVATGVGAGLYAAALEEQRGGPGSGRPTSFVPVADVKDQEMFRALAAGMLGFGVGIVSGTTSGVFARNARQKRVRLSANASTTAMVLNFQGGF